MRKEFLTWFYTTPPEGEFKTRRNGLLWHYCTKYKRNGPHETINYKSKTTTARNKAKIYVAALTPVNAGSDDESVWIIDTWVPKLTNPQEENEKK